MRIAFMGTPAFSVRALDEILADGHEVAAVYTQPPKPRGRGQHLTPSPVHAFAESKGIEVRTPRSMRDPETIEQFAALNLDAAVVVAYGQILPRAVLNAPRLDDSLWSDEEFSMSHFMVGEFEQEKDGTLSWHAVPWARAFWDHRVPNNHAAYSVLAKAAHAGFQPSTGAGDWYFSEGRLRLPAFLAGLLALPMLYLLMQELGLPRAGLAAVVLYLNYLLPVRREQKLIRKLAKLQAGKSA